MDTLKNAQVERVRRAAQRMRQMNQTASDTSSKQDPIELRLEAEKDPDGLLTIKVTNGDCSLSFLLQCSSVVAKQNVHDFLSFIRELVADGFEEWSAMPVQKDGEAPF